MNLEGQIAIPATREQVWDKIWDVSTLASWVIGVTSAEQVDDRTYRAHFEQQVGAVKASFDVKIEVLESVAPKYVVVRVQGQDLRLASTMLLNGRIDLVEAGGKGETTIDYHADLAITGRLGSMGFAVIKHKAAEGEVEFAKRAAAAFGPGAS